MGRRLEYEVKTSVRLNMSNPQHVKINDVIQNLDPKIFKSKNQFIIDAIQFYIDNYGKETFVIKKKEKERAEYIRSEDIEDIIRPEDYVPSYAGGNSRIDFYLPKYETYIETKMTREGLRDKEVGEQLAIDIARYGDKCKTLVCFIYDKGSFLSNPYGLISDLEALSSDRLQVKVYIAPI